MDGRSRLNVIRHNKKIIKRRNILLRKNREKKMVIKSFRNDSNTGELNMVDMES